MVRNLLIAGLLVVTLTMCWCGADGPPRPPKPAAEPAAEAVTEAPDEDGER
jgi:hypothetical protein